MYSVDRDLIYSRIRESSRKHRAKRFAQSLELKVQFSRYLMAISPFNLLSITRNWRSKRCPKFIPYELFPKFHWYHSILICLPAGNTVDNFRAWYRRTRRRHTQGVTDPPTGSGPLGPPLRIVRRSFTDISSKLTVTHFYFSFDVFASCGRNASQHSERDGLTEATPAPASKSRWIYAA